MHLATVNLKGGISQPWHCPECGCQDGDHPASCSCPCHTGR